MSGGTGTPCNVSTDCKPAGVYLYNKADCSDANAQDNITDLPDLGLLKNKVNAINVVQDPTSDAKFMSFLFTNTNFWGRCQYHTPNESKTGCTSVGTMAGKATSASVFQVDMNPSGDGVYFYRKPCFNTIYTPYANKSDMVAWCNENNDGYYEVTNDQIKPSSDGSKFYVAALSDLSYTGTEGGDCTIEPMMEQDCTEYKKNGECAGYQCPTLAGQNISTIIINGNYLVLLLYVDSGNNGDSFTSCQEFPAPQDINNMGPQQVKWENIRNGLGIGGNKVNYGPVIPNYVVIIPIINNATPSHDTSTPTTIQSGGGGS